ncbi:hypothetical protein GCM10027610_111150 [Dactylosporangium cerinum]
MLDELRTLAETALPEEVLEAAIERSGYLGELEESTDPQEVGRVENLQELVSVAREYTERAEATIAVAAEQGDATAAPPPTVAGFLEQVSSSPTPTRSPPTTPTTPASSPS